MSTSSGFSVFSAIFGFVVSAISLLAFVINVCRSNLPSNKIKVLESLLDETETCFKKGIEDGLLTEVHFVRSTERRLARLRTRACGLQFRAYNATTLSQDCLELFRGTSTAIGTACSKLRELRAAVITSSEEGRRRLMEMQPDSHCVPPPSVPIYVECGRPPTSQVHALKITRPRSCPPAFAALKSGDRQHAVTASDPFCDTTLGDWDVRTADTQSRVTTIHTSVTPEAGP